jgi:glutamine synthetase
MTTNGTEPRDTTVRDALQTIKEKSIRFVVLKFVDLFGLLHHLTVPSEAVDGSTFTDGLGFDGSSVRGFQKIHESDMILKPDSTSMFVDPFADDPTLSFFCNIIDPAGRKPYSRDPRVVAQRAEAYLLGLGIADRAYFGPELEFFIFDTVRYDQATPHGFYYVDNECGFWNTGQDGGTPNLGHKPRRKLAYFASPPTDRYQNLRSKMVSLLRSVGVEAEIHHHEVGAAGQSEIGFKYGTLVQQADRALKYKYVVKNAAHRYGKTVTFMPKPLFEENGSGMHVHISLWKKGENLFFKDGGYADLSPLAIHFIGGLLHHAPALCAFCAPSTNSYRRLVPGYEAPINLVYSQRNRSACIRVPMLTSHPKAKRIEFRTPDPSCNPYLAFAAILMAGLDGIEKEMQPPPPIDEDIYELVEHDPDLQIRSTPGSLEEAIRALEDDHEFLLKGDVFTPDLIKTYISYKQENEIDFVRLRPHPAEFMLYYNA